MGNYVHLGHDCRLSRYIQSSHDDGVESAVASHHLHFIARVTSHLDSRTASSQVYMCDRSIVQEGTRFIGVRMCEWCVRVD
jgi:hypothetical protein